MNTPRPLVILATLATTFFLSSTAFAWAVPVHLSTVSKTPTPAGEPIPCSFTNADGQTFNGVVATVNNHVLCVGLVVPTPDDPAEAASVQELYSSLDESFDDAPMCHVAPTEEGTLMQCHAEGVGEGLTWAAVKVCGPGWCHELLSYEDCNDYYATEIAFPDVTCYDLT